MWIAGMTTPTSGHFKMISTMPTKIPYSPLATALATEIILEFRMQVPSLDQLVGWYGCTSLGILNLFQFGDHPGPKVGFKNKK